MAHQHDIPNNSIEVTYASNWQRNEVVSGCEAEEGDIIGEQVGEFDPSEFRKRYAEALRG